MRLLAGAMLACLLLTACTQPPSDSGVRGTVRIGPVSPVQRQGESNDAPYVAEIAVQSDAGTVVARARSGIDGIFTVDLAPGTYTLVPKNGEPLPVARPVEVVVRPHAFTDVAITYDSGIR